MATLDLKPLDDQTIDEMGFNNHDLWLIRIEKAVYGPFETESLKHYALENEAVFEEAVASRMDEHQFRPFWSYPNFQRRKPEVLHTVTHKGPFWLLIKGQKSGPFNAHDIDKKIEMDLLSMIDHISVDDGHHWKKVYEIEGFDRRTHTIDELPLAPTEASFQKAKLQLVEELEAHKENAEEDLAEACFVGQRAKVLTLKLDELTLSTIKAPEVSQSMKWAVPGAAAVIIMLLTTGYMAFAPEMTPLADAEVTQKKPQKERRAPQGIIPEVSKRAPASVGTVAPPRPETRAFNHDSRYPTIIETHNNERPFEEPVVEHFNDEPIIEPSNAEVHSLVTPQDHSLDAAMSGVEQPIDQPVIEEASDF